MKSSFFAICLFVFFFGTVVHAQQNITAGEVINRYVEKIGGEKRWNSIYTSKFRDIISLENGDSIEFITIKAPGKYYIKTTSQGGVWTTIYNKGVAVDIHEGKVDTIRDKEKLDELKLQSYILPDMFYEKLSYKMELLGIQKFNDIDYYEIKLVSPNGKTNLNYYDKVSGLLRMVYNKDNSKSIFPSYKDYNGYLIPDRQFVKRTDGLILDVELKEVLLNGKIDERIFDF